MNDDQTPQNPNQQAVPSDQSDHDERAEKLATDVEWEREDNDAMTEAEKRYSEFQKDGVPLSDEDWEDEEEKDDTIPDHIDATVDASLEELVDQEIGENAEPEA